MYESALDILATDYQDFADGDAMFKRILDFYGLDRDITVAPPGRRFRSGSTDEWRSGLTKDQIRRTTDMFPDRLWRRFGWTR